MKPTPLTPLGPRSPRLHDSGLRLRVRCSSISNFTLQQWLKARPMRGSNRPSPTRDRPSAGTPPTPPGGESGGQARVPTEACLQPQLPTVGLAFSPEFYLVCTRA